LISFKTGASSEYIDGFHNVFGDNYDFINKIIGVSGNVFEIYDDSAFCGGLCVFDISLKVYNEIKTGAYIYGAFILESKRGCGYFKLLLDHVSDFYANEFYDFVLTIPAKSELFSLYEHLGFTDTAYGVISVLGEETKLSLPSDTAIEAFDGDFFRLYFMHVENDGILKIFDLFKCSVEDFEIKYISHGQSEGYALFDNGKLIFASADFANYEKKKKGLIKKLTAFDVPNDFLCDVLFEA
jgi:hypothetical protein